MFTADALIALITLSLLEIILGIDNVIFIAILCGKLPKEQREKARKIGLFLAMFMRVGLLLSLSWIMTLKKPLFTVPDFGLAKHSQAVVVAPAATLPGASQATTAAGGHAATAGHEADNPFEISGRDLILLLGGLFLIAKATWEIHDKLEGENHAAGGGGRAASFGNVITQILVLDLVFSLDSVITAVGMAQQLWVMITAVVLSVGVMLAFSGHISRYIEKHPTLKILALSFLVLIGVMLVIESFGGHVPKGYIYFAMAFSVAVEMLNIRFRKVTKPVALHNDKIPE